MDISVFCELLYSEMIKIGIPDAKADKYVENLKRNLTTADIAGVSENDIPKYARVCADNIARTVPANTSEHTETPAAESDVAASSDKSDKKPVSDTFLTNDTPASDTIQVPREKKYTYAVHNGNDEPADTNIADESEEMIPDTDELYEKPSGKITAKFVLVTIAASPLWIIAAAIFLAPFAVMYAAEIAFIAALIVLLAGCTALGTAASLTGIVYGVVKMFSTPAVGLYEIGFGVIIAGVAMICGILIYNGAVRFMPWVIKKSGMLFKFAFSKIKPLLTEYKRRLQK